MSQFGTSLPISLFGESHGEAIGVTIHNLPAGIKINHASIKNALFKRRPKSKLSTPRQEKDAYKIITGIFNDFTTGAPLTILIPNNDTRSKDYKKEILRPSHSDYTAHIKYKSFHDYRGGGHFSGRLTAALVALGAICNDILVNKGIYITSHIASIKAISDDKFNNSNLNNDLVKKLNKSDLPVIKDAIKKDYIATIKAAKANKDSVGGTIETAILNFPQGAGGPYFEKLESLIASMVFSMPAVKGVSFGDGFDITHLYGSEANDPFYIDDTTIKTITNHSGGIQGGISNGMPIIFKTAIKPTSSIGLEQKTVDINKMTETTLKLEGRHDPAIVHRIIHVINAVTSYVALEAITKEEGHKWMI